MDGGGPRPPPPWSMAPPRPMGEPSQFGMGRRNSRRVRLGRFERHRASLNRNVRALGALLHLESGRGSVPLGLGSDALNRYSAHLYRNSWTLPAYSSRIRERGGGASAAGRPGPGDSRAAVDGSAVDGCFARGAGTGCAGRRAAGRAPLASAIWSPRARSWARGRLCPSRKAIQSAGGTRPRRGAALVEGST